MACPPDEAIARLTEAMPSDTAEVQSGLARALAKSPKPNHERIGKLTSAAREVFEKQKDTAAVQAPSTWRARS